MLSKYLISEESRFEVKLLDDFLQTLNILGFHRCYFADKKENNTYRYVHQHFSKDQEVPQSLFSQPIDATFSLLKNTKRMICTSGTDLIERLNKSAARSQLKMTKIELARMRLKFALQKQVDMMTTKVAENIQIDIEVPDYITANEIAGFYGNVPLELLEKGFCEYFPMYQDPSIESVTQNSTQPQPAATDSIHQLIDINEIPIIEEQALSSEFVPEILQVIPTIRSSPDIHQNDEPHMKRRNTRREQKLASDELKQALLSLQNLSE